MIKYVKIFCDIGDTVDDLSDAEAGRLFKAVLHYGATQTVDQLPGQERLVFRMLKAQMDRDRGSYEKKSQQNRENGLKGGRPKKAIGFQENPEKSNGLFQNPEKPNKSQDKDKDKDKDYISSSVGFFDDDDEAFAIQQDHNEILDAAERVGLASNDFERDDLIGLYAEHGKPALLAALDQYGKHKGKSIAYLRAILAGGPKKQTADDPNADYFATAVRL